MAARDGRLDETTRRRLFGDIVMPHLDDALSLARWLTGNPTDAEDVVQDSCLRALKGLDSYAGGNPRAWLLTIVRHTSFSWLARNRPKAIVLVDSLEEAEERSPKGSDEPVDAETSLIARDNARAFEAALAALPVHYRETIVLREVNGLTYREIAEVTSTPVGTVMSRLARARAMMIAALSEVVS